MNKRRIFFLCILFIVSRLPFINTQPVFFDSAAYLKAFSLPNILDAVVAVHFPLHDGYIILFWPFYQVANFFMFNAALAVILCQIIVAMATLYFFYKCVEYIADKHIALLAAIIIACTPLFWISNVTILYEISYVGLFFGALYLLTVFLKRKKSIYLYLSILLLCAALFTHMMVTLWIPLYLSVLYFKGRKYLFKTIMIIIILFISFALLRTLTVSIVTHNDFAYVFQHMYLGNYGNAGSITLTLHSALVSTRNFVIPLMRGYTILVVLLSFLGFVILYFKNIKYFTYGVLWVGPAFIALQFWDAQLPGRYAILAGFGLAFLTAYLLKKHRIYASLLVCYLLIVSVPALNLLRSEIPYIKLSEYTKTLPKDSLLIESHFSRRQVQDAYKGKLLSVNEPHISGETIEKEINMYLTNKKDVFISSAALTDPYGLFSGPYLHTLSLSYAKPPEMQRIIEKYTLSHYAVIDAADTISMYKIISTKDNPYPKIPSMKYHYRRIDNFDPIWHLYRISENYVLSLK